MTPWSRDLAPHIRPHLTPSDDPALWSLALDLILTEAIYLLPLLPTSTDLFTRIGMCNHWLRPHQTRWTQGGGFAWPAGYGGKTDSRISPPQCEWSERFFWNQAEEHWQHGSPAELGKRMVTFQIILPGRTIQHAQAAVYTAWEGGVAPAPRKGRLLQYYGFRSNDAGWRHVASSKNLKTALLYERAAAKNAQE